MTVEIQSGDVSSQPPLPADLDLQTVLGIWQTATDRLQATHETLRDEVRRLTAEVELKNIELQRKNRLADLGQVTAHVAHEVRNSLVPLTLYLSLLRRDLASDPASLEIIDQLETGFTAVESTVSDLLSFTADRRPDVAPLDAAGLLNDIAMSLAPQLTAQEIGVEIRSEAELNLQADAAMVRRAVLNLVLNAIDAMPGGGQLLLSAGAGAAGCWIEVADTGEGLHARTAAELLEPFFTTKSTGAGLGLAIVNRVMQSHGGNVAIASRSPRGAAFTLTFPPHASSQPDGD